MLFGAAAVLNGGLTEIKALPQVDVATESVEDQALAIYQDKQAMVMVKGVDDRD